VVGGSFDLEREDAAGFLDFLQQREVVFEEEVKKFLLATPGGFVVLLHDVGLVGRALRRRALGERGRNEQDRQQERKRSLHMSLRTRKIVLLRPKRSNDGWLAGRVRVSQNTWRSEWPIGICGSL